MPARRSPLNLNVFCSQTILHLPNSPPKEYIVDTVSRDGIHKVTAVWLMGVKPGYGGSFTQYSAVLVSGGERGVPELTQYTRELLACVGVVNGPATTKLLLTVTGPRLLSCAPCVHGGLGVRDQIARQALGYSQVGGWVQAG